MYEDTNYRQKVIAKLARDCNLDVDVVDEFFTHTGLCPVALQLQLAAEIQEAYNSGLRLTLISKRWGRDNIRTLVTIAMSIRANKGNR